MKSIKSVIIQINSLQVITVHPEFFLIPNSHPGQRISLLQVDDQPFMIPKIAYVLNSGKNLEILPQEPLDLKPGQSLIISQPAGVGFTEFEKQVRILMLINELENSYLYNLIHQSPKSKQWELSVLTTGKNYNYPEWVELITKSQFKETCNWADRIYLEATQSNLDETIYKIMSTFAKQDQKKVEIFTQANYGCAGIGECGLCAVNILNKKILLCQQGPVIKLVEYL